MMSNPLPIYRHMHSKKADTGRWMQRAHCSTVAAPCVLSPGFFSTPQPFMKHYYLQSRITHTAMIKYLCRLNTPAMFHNAPALTLISLFKDFYPLILLTALIYYERFLERAEVVDNNCYLFIHMYLVSCIVSVKYWDDGGATAFWFCERYDISEEQFKKLEREFLRVIDYDLELNEGEVYELMSKERLIGYKSRL